MVSPLHLKQVVRRSRARQAAQDPLAPDVVLRIRYLWEEMRAERANQAAILACIYGAATALLAFDGVFLLIALASGAPLWSRVGATAVAAWSAWVIARCLFGGSQRTDLEGRTYREGSLAIIDPDHLAPVEELISDNVILELYGTEKSLVKRNLYEVIDPKRTCLGNGLKWFMTAVVIIAAGEVQELIVGWLK